MLSVQLLGRPQLLLDGRHLDVPRRKSRAIVYYLAAHRKPLSREVLLALLWPDLDRPAAQQTLRATLHELRKTLGEALIAGRESLALAPSTEVDTVSFESRLAPTRTDITSLSVAMELYRGDFLDGFALPDCEEFEDWVSAERERLRNVAVRGLTALAEEHERRGAFAEALIALKRALAFDPLQEDLQRAAMRVHYLAGDRAAAIRRYESLRKLLNKEMGVPPMVETRALYDAIIADTLPTSIGQQAAGSATPLQVKTRERHEPAFDHLPFIGRESERNKLRELSGASPRTLALIEGEPGIGKTRLAEEFIRESATLAIVGVGHELEQSLPYHPIIEALRGLLSHPDWPALDAGLRTSLPAIWRGELARLLPEIAGASPVTPRGVRSTDEWRIWEAVYQLLIAIARQRQVIVFLDDLHWADASTVGMLGYLVRQEGAAPITFIGATRPITPKSALTKLVQTLTRERRLSRLALARLTQTDVTDIARFLSPTYAYALADWLMRASEGNPYILAELIRYAHEEGVLLPDGTVNLSALSASPVLPQPIYSLIQARLERLSGDAHSVLDVAVAAGREFQFEIVARAAGLSEDSALDALDELKAAGLVRPLDGWRYAFDHSLTMEVAFRETSEPRHSLMHRRVAEAMEKLNGGRLEDSAGLLAWHFAEGNAPERAAPYALLAGQQAARLGAWPEAISFFEQALAGTGSGDRLAILMSLGEARFADGRYGEAAQAFDAALQLGQSRDDTEAADAAALALARSFLPQGRYTEVVEIAERMRDEGRPESMARAEYTWGTALSLEGADLAGAARHLEAAQARYAEHAPADTADLAQTKFELGGVAAQQGDLEKAVSLYREALAVAQHAVDREAALTYLVLAHNNLGYHLHLLKDPSAKEYALAGLGLAQERGLVGFQPYLLSTLGEIALAADDLAEAERFFSEGLAIAERLSIPERTAGLTANMGIVALRRGDTALAVDELSAAKAQADALGTRHLSAQIRVWLAPLLPASCARACLAEARQIAVTGGRRRLIEEIEAAEAQIPPA